MARPQCSSAIVEELDVRIHLPPPESHRTFGSSTTEPDDAASALTVRCNRVVVAFRRHFFRRPGARDRTGAGERGFRIVRRGLARSRCSGSLAALIPTATRRLIRTRMLSCAPATTQTLNGTLPPPVKPFAIRRDHRPRSTPSQQRKPTLSDLHDLARGSLGRL
jgi:hypothetical protein